MTVNPLHMIPPGVEDFITSAHCTEQCLNQVHDALWTHWGWVMHICVGKLTTIGSDNGLSLVEAKSLTEPMLIGPLGTKFREIFIEIHIVSLNKVHLKMSSGNWRPFCFLYNVLKLDSVPCSHWRKFCQHYMLYHFHHCRDAIPLRLLPFSHGYPSCLKFNSHLSFTQGLADLDSGIRIFGGLLHTHLAGVSVVVRHIRNGIELPPILEDRSYDFDYQNFIFLDMDEEVTVLPVSRLIWSVNPNIKNGDCHPLMHDDVMTWLPRHCPCVNESTDGHTN